MLHFYICVFLACVSSALAQTTVHTEYGSVWSDVSITTKHGNKFLAFRGIPYAAAPLGPLRFQSPHKHEKWFEPRNATAYGSACFQFSGKRGAERRGVALPFGTSEDCLFVNVYTPDVEPKKLLPVLVYIHGGAFQVGTGNWFMPNNFMDSQPIVMVTFNYRLGVFGFLSSGDEVVPGNYALKDQLAALKWVQANIRNFGGDPKNVTLMGQSSGAHNVHTHTLSHASEGLFHRAIILSGSALSMWGYYPPQSHEAQHTYNLLLERVECNKGSPEMNVKCLRELSASDLKKAEEYFLANHTIPFIFRAVIEPAKVHDAFLTNDPRELKYPNPKIPIIVGACSAEGMMNAFMFLGGHVHQGEFSRALDENLPFSVHYKYWIKPDHIPSFTEKLKNYFFENPQRITIEDLPSMSKLFGKMLFQMPAVDMAISYPGKVYAYFYDHLNEASPWNRMKHDFNVPSLNNFTGAEHGDDLISIFGPQNPQMLPLPSADQKISDQMVAYLKNFIYTGNPNSKTTSLPKWNAVYTKKVEYMHIAKEGCRQNSGWAEDPTYAFYRSLPVPWRRMPNDVAGGATKLSNHVWHLTLIAVILYCYNF